MVHREAEAAERSSIFVPADLQTGPSFLLIPLDTPLSGSLITTHLHPYEEASDSPGPRHKVLELQGTPRNARHVLGRGQGFHSTEGKLRYLSLIHI